MVMINAQFTVGQIVQHKLFDYRGIIIDVDADFQGTDEWYEQMAKSKPPKDQPWYHVLVDQANYQTYVAERNLVVADDQGSIRHPLLDTVLERTDTGLYISRNRFS